MLDELKVKEEIPKMKRTAFKLIHDSHTAEDLVQTALVKAYTSSFDGKNLGGWLNKIVHNTTVDYLRYKARRPREHQLIEDTDLDFYSAPLEDSYFDQRVDPDIAECVKQLDPLYRDVLILRTIHDMSPAEVAARLDIPTGTVYSRLNRATAKMRDMLSERKTNVSS